MFEDENPLRAQQVALQHQFHHLFAALQVVGGVRKNHVELLGAALQVEERIGLHGIEVAANLIRRGEFVRYPISKLIWAGLIIALIFLGAMFILPVVGAVLIGVFALSCLIWLSSKVFGFFQGERTYTEDNPGDYYDASARTSIVPKKWNKTQAVDAEVIEVEEIKKEK